MGPKPSLKAIKFSNFKLVVIETQGAYYRSLVCAFGIGISHIFIGATMMAAIMYTLYSGDLHAAFCTAYHCLMAEGILSHSFLNGWSTPLRSGHKEIAHIVLQACAILCAVGGTIHVLTNTTPMSTTHCATGLIAYILTFMCLVTGIGLFITNMDGRVKLVHFGFGLSAFIMVSCSIISGFFMDDFQCWAHNGVVYILVTCVVFYTICMLASTTISFFLLKKSQ